MVSQMSSQLSFLATGAAWRAETPRLTCMMKVFMSSAILPAMQSESMKKLTPEMTIKLKVGMKRLLISGLILLLSLRIIPVIACVLLVTR